MSARPLWLAVGLAIGILIVPKPSCAADTWLSATIASHHTDRTRNHNERNWGLGFEHELSDTWRVVGGEYKNSYYRQTVYGGFLWLPVHEGRLRFGFTLSGATGYTNAIDPIVMPTLTYEDKAYGLNIGIMPAIDKRIVNVFGLQLKVKF